MANYVLPNLPVGVDTVGNGFSIVSDTTPLPVTSEATTAGGATGVVLAAVNATLRSVKATPGKVYGVAIDNTANASVVYVQMFNNTTGAAALGTPLYCLTAKTGDIANIVLPPGIDHSVGICLAATTAITGTTGPATGIGVNVFYK